MIKEILHKDVPCNPNHTRSENFFITTLGFHMGMMYCPATSAARKKILRSSLRIEGSEYQFVRPNVDPTTTVVAWVDGSAENRENSEENRVALGNSYFFHYQKQERLQLDKVLTTGNPS
jgi:hypothetical protein